MRKSLILITSLFFAIVTVQSQTPPIIYVTGDGSGNYNCDGISDQIEINQALDFVVANPNYTTVYLKGPNTYWIDEPILISSNCNLKGDANARVQVIDIAGWTLNKPLIAQKGSEYWAGGVNQGDLGLQIYGSSTDILKDVEISGFELTAGNQAASTGSWYYILMLFHLADNVNIHNMYLHDSYGDIIRMLGNSWNISQNVSIHDNLMEYSGHDGLYFAGIDTLNTYNNEILHTRTNDGIRFEECKNVNIYNNIIGNDITSVASGYAGILLYNAGEFLTNAEIYNNYIYGKAGSIVLEAGTTKEYQNGVYIHHNKIFKTFDNTAGGASFLNGGIHIYGAHNTLIEFNSIVGSQKDGIIFEIGQGLETGYQTIVQNNIIVNSDNYGINNLSNNHIFIINNNDIFNCNNGYYNNTSSSTDIHLNPLFDTGISTNDPNLVDLHLKSEYGRWDGITWVIDSVTSPCIDAGLLASGYDNEPLPNGNRANIGVFGNTIEASKSSNPLSIIDYFNTDINIYPNPTSDEIIFPNEFITNEYSIYSLTGKQIKSGKLNMNKIKVTDLKSGVYILKIKDNKSDKMIVFKMIKE